MLYESRRADLIKYLRFNIMSNKKVDNAIDNIHKQILKGNETNLNYNTWKIQSQSIVELYFSSNSKEYIWFDRRLFSDAHYGFNVEEHYRQETIKAIKEIQDHLTACVDTLKIKGIFESPKVNYLSRISDTWLTYIIGLIISAIVFSFFVGRWTVQTENKSITTPFFETKDKSENKADSTKDTTGNKNNLR